MNLVRHSKYRHVYGKVATRDESFDDIRFTNTPIDSNLITVSKKFLAFIEETMGGGSFTVVSLKDFGRISRNNPRVIGHQGVVLDIVFSPFNDSIIASASADSKVRIWEIPEGGLLTDLHTPNLELNGHDRKVTTLCWHPTTMNVLVSGGLDQYLIVWNTSTGVKLNCLSLNDGLSQCSFNYNGSMMAAVLRNKELVVFDPRGDVVEKSVIPHSGTRPARCVFVRNNRIFTCGFEKGTSRTLALWNADDLNQPICRMNFDQNRGHMTLHYEPEHEIIFVAGRGEGFISIFELTKEDPYIHYLTNYQSSNSSQKAVGILPKLACDHMKCEIVRGYRGLNSGFCEIISFIVPRKSGSFQSDLFTEIRSDVPAMTVEEYMSGMNADPIMISLNPNKERTDENNAVKLNNSNKIETKSVKPGTVESSTCESNIRVESVLQTELKTELNNSDQIPQTELKTELNNSDQIPQTELKTEPNNSDQIPQTELKTEPNNSDQIPQTELKTEPNNSDQISKTELKTELNNSDQIPQTELKIEPNNSDQIPREASNLDQSTNDQQISLKSTVECAETDPCVNNGVEKSPENALDDAGLPVNVDAPETSEEGGSYEITSELTNLMDSEVSINKSEMEKISSLLNTLVSKVDSISSKLCEFERKFDCFVKSSDKTETAQESS